MCFSLVQSPEDPGLIGADAVQSCRCGFFEWEGDQGDKRLKQPYAIAKKYGQPFGIGCSTGERERPLTGCTFAVITMDAE